MNTKEFKKSQYTIFLCNPIKNKNIKYEFFNNNITIFVCISMQVKENKMNNSIKQNIQIYLHDIK